VHLGAPLGEILQRMNLPAAMGPHFKATAKGLLHIVSISHDIVAALRRFRLDGHILALFTGKDSERTWEMLKHFSVHELFDVVVSGDDVKQGKPDPEGLLSILSRTATPADHAVYIGDSPNDIECAHRAGTLSVAVAWGMATQQDLLAARPSCFVDRPSQLYQSVSTLPGFKRQTAVRQQRIIAR
jgi:phosphoglycolate phosphatase-like HAD superfamily hydrolase